jgi:hypothetical protein
LLEVSVPDLQFLFDLGRSCQLADIKVNIIRIVAGVGVAFSKQKNLPNVDILKVSWNYITCIDNTVMTLTTAIPITTFFLPERGWKSLGHIWVLLKQVL